MIPMSSMFHELTYVLCLLDLDHMVRGRWELNLIEVLLLPLNVLWL